MNQCHRQMLNVICWDTAALIHWLAADLLFFMKKELELQRKMSKCVVKDPVEKPSTVTASFSLTLYVVFLFIELTIYRHILKSIPSTGQKSKDNNMYWQSFMWKVLSIHWQYRTAVQLEAVSIIALHCMKQQWNLKKKILKLQWWICQLCSLWTGCYATASCDWSSFCPFAQLKQYN